MKSFEFYDIGKNDNAKQDQTLRLSQTFVRANNDMDMEQPSFGQLLQDESLITHKNDFTQRPR